MRKRTAEPAQPTAEELALRRLLADRTDELAARLVDERLTPRLAAFLRRRFAGLAREDADDLAREALADALAHGDRFDAARASATTWLYGIAKLRAVEHFRRRGREEPLVEDWSGEDEEDAGSRRRHAASIRRATARLFPSPAADPALARMVREAIASLPEQQRRAAEAHYLDGRAPREVDDAYGWRPNTANVYLSHARRAMRGKLEALGVPLRAPTSAAGPVAQLGGANGLVAQLGAVNAPIARAGAARQRFARIAVGRGSSAWAGAALGPVALPVTALAPDAGGAVPFVYAVGPLRRPRLALGRAWSVPLPLAA